MSRNSPCDFLGRHASAGPIEGRSGGLDGLSLDSPVVQSFGVFNQPGEVTVDSGTADSISGVSDRLSEFDDRLSEFEFDDHSLIYSSLFDRLPLAYCAVLLFWSSPLDLQSASLD